MQPWVSLPFTVRPLDPLAKTPSDDCPELACFLEEQLGCKAVPLDPFNHLWGQDASPAGLCFPSCRLLHVAQMYTVFENRSSVWTNFWELTTQALHKAGDVPWTWEPRGVSRCCHGFAPALPTPPRPRGTVILGALLSLTIVVTSWCWAVDTREIKTVESKAHRCSQQHQTGSFPKPFMEYADLSTLTSSPRPEFETSQVQFHFSQSECASRQGPVSTKTVLWVTHREGH